MIAMLNRVGDVLDFAMAEIVEQFGLRQHRPDGEITLFHARGCDACGGRGYLGRTVVMEALKMTDRIRDGLARVSPLERGVFLIPANATEASPPSAVAGQVAVTTGVRGIDESSKYESNWRLCETT